MELRTGITLTRGAIDRWVSTYHMHFMKYINEWCYDVHEVNAHGVYVIMRCSYSVGFWSSFFYGCCLQRLLYAARDGRVNPRPHACNVCNVSFSRRHDLRRHEQSAGHRRRLNTTSEFICRRCGSNAFQTAAELVEHTQRCTGKRL
jgi:hypothetical protein